MARADAKLRLKGGDKVDTFSLRRQMLLRIASLEKIIPNLRGSAAGIGHNRALDSIEPIPFCDQDLKVVEALLAVLEAQPPQLPTVTTRAVEAAARLSAFGEQIKAHVARRADIFVSKPSTLDGPEFGNRLLIYYVLADKLLAIAQAALDWLNWPTRDLKRPASVKLAADIGVKEIHLPPLVFFEEGAAGLTRPIKHSTNGRPATWSTMPQAPRGQARFAREQLTS
jgi:hypothetical protein